MPSKSSSRIYLILDDVRSMENVGAIFRTADAANVSKIYLCGITPKPPRKEIDKAAVGAVDFVDWEYLDNLRLLIPKLKKEGIKIFALEQDKRSTQYSSVSAGPSPDGKFSIQNSCAIIVGNEVNGISKETLDLCDEIIEIPMSGQKNSLNVSVATGIVLFKLREIYPIK